MTVRVAPVPTWPSDLLRAAEAVVGGEVRPNANVYRTLANHPDLMLAWLALGSHLLRASTLEPRLRELAILRTTALAAGAYPHAQHQRIGREVGLSAAEIRHTLDDDPSTHWHGLDRAVLSAIDHLCARGELDDATWNPVRAALSTEQILDLLATVAFYRMASWLLNACGTPLDDGSAPIPVAPPNNDSSTSADAAAGSPNRCSPSATSMRCAPSGSRPTLCESSLRVGASHCERWPRQDILGAACRRRTRRSRPRGSPLRESEVMDPSHPEEGTGCRLERRGRRQSRK